jgi:hypothetical protein
MMLVHLSDLSDTQTGTCQRPSTGLEIARCLRRGPRTAGPGGDDLCRRSESASAASSLRHPSTRNSDRSASASLARAVPFLAEGT